MTVATMTDSEFALFLELDEARVDATALSDRALKREARLAGAYFGGLPSRDGLIELVARAWVGLPCT